MADFAGHFGDGALLAGKESFHSFLTEMLHVELAHDVIQLVQRAIRLLGLFSIGDGLVVPIVVERGIISIRLQHLHVQRQVGVIQHPMGQVIFVQIFLAIVLVLLLVDKSLVFTPVVILELIEDTFAHRISDMLQDTQFRIHHALDAERIQLLGTCHPDAPVRSRIGRFVKLQRKLVHVLKLVGADNVAVDLIFTVHEEDAGKDIIADNLGQFLQGIDGQTIVIHVAVNGQPVGHAFDTVVIQLDFSTPCHILRIPTSGLQSVQLHHGRITVLVITSLVHIALGQVHLGNHDVRQDFGIGERLARLRNHVNDGTRTGAATQTGKDMNSLPIGIAGYQLATGIGIAQTVDIADGVRREEQTASPTFLSGGLPQ